MPGSTIGEPVPLAERAARRAEVGGDDSLRASRAMYALDDEHSQEMLEQLLVALAKRNIGAPSRLTVYAGDPRVQPALLDAVLTVPLENLPNFAQGLGMVGGPGARDALQARMREAMAHPEVFAPHAFLNPIAGAAMTCAEYLLGLDPEMQDAADALVRLASHVCRFNRRQAVWKAAEALRRHRGMQTKPLRDLRAALTALVDTRDDEVFCLLAAALWKDPHVPARVARLLESRSLAKQQLALGTLWKVEHRGWPMLIKWASRPRDPVLILTTLGPNACLLPESRRVQVVARGLANVAPTIRHEAVSLLGTLEAAVAVKLARHALKDEPDPALRLRLAAAGRATRPHGASSRRGARRRRQPRSTNANIRTIKFA
jgi:hypothetical protein